jgi:hypothetical protein
VWAVIDLHVGDFLERALLQEWEELSGHPVDTHHVNLEAVFETIPRKVHQLVIPTFISPRHLGETYMDSTPANAYSHTPALFINTSRPLPSKAFSASGTAFFTELWSVTSS